jgi:hypothetical protein
MLIEIATRNSEDRHLAIRQSGSDFRRQAPSQLIFAHSIHGRLEACQPRQPGRLSSV